MTTQEGPDLPDSAARAATLRGAAAGLTVEIGQQFSENTAILEVVGHLARLSWSGQPLQAAYLGGERALRCLRPLVGQPPSTAGPV